MQLNLNPLPRYLVVTTVLAMGAALFFESEGLSWFLERYQDAVTRQSVAAMVFIFVALYVFVGGGAAISIRREQRSLRDLCEGCQGKVWSPFLGSVLDDVDECLTISSERKMKVDPFLDAYDQKIHEPVSALRRSEKLLVKLGLLGTVIGIAVGFSVPSSDVLTDSDAAQRFSFEALGGIGLALTTTMVGLSGSLVMNLLRSGYESKVEGMTSDFGIYLEALLLRENILESEVKDVS